MTGSEGRVISGQAEPHTKTLVFEAQFHRRRQGHGIALREGPPPPPPEPKEPVRRPARSAITLALAHKIEQAIRDGDLKDRADAARRLGVSRARITQICDLTLMPVKEQERILYLETVDRKARSAICVKLRFH